MAAVIPLIAAQLNASDWIAAGATALSTILVAFIIRRLTKRRVRKKDKHAELTDFGGRMLISLVLATGAYYTLEALDVELAPALGAFGIGALFIAVGLQPLLVNLVGSVVLQARRPFRRGDQILSNGYEGTVLDISSTSTVLLSYDGESIHIPNSQVLGQPLVNWTHEPVRRTILPITVPYGCELPQVLAQVGRAARQALNDENLPPAEALATSFGAHGIEIDLRFWHYSDQLESQVALSQVVVAVNDALNEASVVIPYNQLVVHPVTTVADAEARTPPVTDG
ncbi:MAG: small conductance mechanosensitive channel [Acidimicrobiales bacterium]|jgi:small-conductance mechanosensitive channel